MPGKDRLPQHLSPQRMALYVQSSTGKKTTLKTIFSTTMQSASVHFLKEFLNF